MTLDHAALKAVAERSAEMAGRTDIAIESSDLLALLKEREEMIEALKAQLAVINGATNRRSLIALARKLTVDALARAGKVAG